MLLMKWHRLHREAKEMAPICVGRCSGGDGGGGVRLSGPAGDPLQEAGQWCGVVVCGLVVLLVVK